MKRKRRKEGDRTKEDVREDKGETEWEREHIGKKDEEGKYNKKQNKNGNEK